MSLPNCSLHYAVFLLRLFRPCVVCVFNKVDMKRIRIQIYYLWNFSRFFFLARFHYRRNSLWHVTLILLTLFSPSVCFTSTSFYNSQLPEHFLQQMKFMCVATLIYGSVFDSTKASRWWQNKNFILQTSSDYRSLITVCANNFTLFW